MTVFANGGTATSFRLPLSEGEYRLEFSNVVAPFYVKSMMYGSVDLLKSPLVADRDASKEIHIVIGRNQ